MRLLLFVVLLALANAAQDDLTRLRPGRPYRSSSNNPDPNSNDDSLRPIPGETITLADLTGPGMVNHIWLTVAANEYGWPRLLRLRVYYDGSATPSVDVPVGDFFAAGHGYERPVNSLMVVNGSSGRSRNSYWRMPFHKSCRITLTNEGRRRVSNVYYHVDWEKRTALPPDTAYFHAWYRQEIPARSGMPYTVLNVQGTGQYVGTLLNVIQNEAGWFGEGDELIYIDGEKTASIQGTGTEDYFNDAWSLRVSSGPYWGVPVAEGTGPGARMSAYRWHLRDPLPFKKSLRFDFEHAGWTYNANGSVRSAFEERADLFSSVAFWYQQGIARGLPELPYGSARLPHGNARQIEAESLFGAAKTSTGRVEVQKEVFWSRDLLLFRASSPGASLELPIDVPEAGHYEIVAQAAHAPDYGDYRVLLDSKPLQAGVELEHEPGANAGAEPAIQGWHSELYVAEDHLLGWVRLAPGRHTLTFVCTGKDARSTGYHLGLDTLILARIASPEATLPPAVPKTPAALIEAMDSPDPILRGLAAVALRDLGAQALPALTRLARALRQDQEIAVRMRAADAIAVQGRAALPVLGDLIAAAEAPNEHVHVQRSVALALGRIGPQAASAVPVLRKLEGVPRVGPAATTAIRSILPAGR
ncbi:MAG: DUF2961 domain-containing protein [Acidobacteria bacterium]|nr:DUF2961 domain-containing protein [Acidobacteriota bacterium]